MIPSSGNMLQAKVQTCPMPSGPNLKFHHSKLNFEWSKGGAEVKWHQDIPAWPHTNYTPCTAGTYRYDCGREQGPLAILKGSHEGPIYSEYDEAGRWVGCLSKVMPPRSICQKSSTLMVKPAP
jgi:hypothetical protein